MARRATLQNPFLGQPTPLGSLMTAAGQRLAQELNTALVDAGFPDLRAAHAPVFMALDPEGTRVTELAARTRMTKQAVGELVRYLETRGYLSVAPDPADARVRRVSLTDDGWRAIATGERVIAEFDAWLEESIGAGQVARLRATLTAIADTTVPVRPVRPVGQAERRPPARARR
jgi:DNA-binding MarR family transcriptional regulator